MKLEELLKKIKKEEYYIKKNIIEKKMRQLGYEKTISSKYIIDTTNCLHLLVDRICKNDCFFYILIDEYGMELIMPDYEFKKNIKDQRFQFIEE